MATGSLRRPVTLDDLVALNDEIAALARAGVPLDLGLQAVGRDWNGGSGKLAAAVGERLAQGEPLEQILADRAHAGLPKTYAAVVAAGIKTGRLTTAVEGIAHVMRRAAQLRSHVLRSMIYPLLLLLLAYGLFLFWIARIAPVMLESYEFWEMPDSWFPAIVGWLIETAPIWKVGLPLALGVYAAWSVWRVSQLTSGAGDGWFGWGLVALFARMRLAADRAVLADLLAVFLENRVPLNEGLTLSAAGLTTRRLKRSVEQAAEKLTRGETLSAEGSGLPPPIVCALLASFPERAPAAVRRVARRYHEEAQQRARWISTYLPILLVSGVAFTVVLCYALLSIVPWLMILQQLGRAG